MKLHILGCSGSFPAAGGATAGYLVTSGHSSVLLDMGSGVLSKLMALCDPAGLDGIILSHWHYDHACDLLPLQYYLQATGRRMDIYAPALDAPLRRLCLCPQFTLHDLTETSAVGAFSVSACPVRHPMPCLAVKLRAEDRTLVYTGDAMGKEELTAFVRDADLLLCDATFTDRQWKPSLPHMSARMAGELAAASDRARLIITHIPPVNDGQTLLKEAAQAHADTLLAYSGLTTEI